MKNLHPGIMPAFIFELTLRRRFELVVNVSPMLIG
jgi:hypothetical protein